MVDKVQSWWFLIVIVVIPYDKTNGGSNPTLTTKGVCRKSCSRVGTKISVMEKAFLTNGGNLLRFHPTQKFYFQKPNGEFIREVSNSEAEFLCQNCLEVDVHFPNEHPEFLPTWHFIKSVQVVEDNSNYRWDTCNNGGNYSFQTYHDWFVAKYPDGEWKFAFVENHYTSAEFSYDELVGSFQSDIGNLYLSNVADNKGQYQSQAGIEWVNEEKFYTSSEVLEKIGTIAYFSDLWNEVYEYIPSCWDEDDESYTSSVLSFTNKKEIISFLKEMGVQKSSKPSRRGGKGGQRNHPIVK